MMGVSPMASTMLSYTRPRPGACSARVGEGASMTRLLTLTGGQCARNRPASAISDSARETASQNVASHNSLHCEILMTQTIAKQTHLCRDIVNHFGVCYT